MDTQYLTLSSLMPVSSSGPRELEPSLLPGIRTRFFCLEKQPEARDGERGEESEVIFCEDRYLGTELSGQNRLGRLGTKENPALGQMEGSWGTWRKQIQGWRGNLNLG